MEDAKVERVLETAQARRREIQARAAAMGIDEAFISTLVDTFYGRIRAHETLGPIFAERIGDDWAPHLARMKAFWSSVALNSGAYSGKPVQAHMKLTSVRPEHFGLWLGLFRSTLEDLGATSEATAYFMERAGRIARSLEMAMFESATPSTAPVFLERRR